MNERGYNIYIGVNPRKEFNSSGDKNVKLVRFFFADFDSIGPGDGCGIWEVVSDLIYQAGIDTPDFAVFSGHGVHTYWKLPEPMTDFERWRKIQGGLAKKLGSKESWGSLNERHIQACVPGLHIDQVRKVTKFVAR